LLEELRRPDLALLYQLLARVPAGHAALKTAFIDHLKVLLQRVKN
jgi:hypothetical protein